MDTQEGSKRKVFVFKRFVLKFAKVYLKKYLMTHGAIWKQRIQGNVIDDPSWNGYLTEGFLENINERTFYKKTNHQFLVPTYFTFFGIFNIQKRVEVLFLNEEEWGIAVLKASELEENDIGWFETHSFNRSNNFGFSNGNLMMLDYGDDRSHEDIMKFGMNIFNNFKSKKQEIE